ncbi:MAG TPA: hypothetical protein VMF12_11865 [Xanthobacteraceae bacterium]|nr:hypothetical protein [Xanthobacteraceae bacterium]
MRAATFNLIEPSYRAQHGDAPWRDRGAGRRILTDDPAALSRRKKLAGLFTLEETRRGARPKIAEF